MDDFKNAMIKYENLNLFLQDEKKKIRQLYDDNDNGITKIM